MISEQNLIIASVLAIAALGILTKIRIIPQKYFQTLFDIIFFVYVYICFKYAYMDIMKAAATVNRTPLSRHFSKKKREFWP